MRNWTRSTRFRSLSLLLLLSLFLTGSPAGAAAPEARFPITFTTTLAPGTVYPFTFSIWDARTGGRQVAGWVEGPVKLPVASNKTVYFVLGSKVALPALDFSQQYWVQISTGLKQYRTRLPAAGYSFWSKSVDTEALDARYVEEGEADAISTRMIADGQFTATKVSSESAGAGTVLTADGSGGAGWQAVSGGAGGDITGVTAGNGLTDGGTTGDVTLNVGAGTGVSVAADTVAVDTAWANTQFVNEGQTDAVATAMIANGAVTDAKISGTIAGSKLGGHQHAGGDITSGTVAEAFVVGAIARDSEIVPTVLAADGAGSTLDADLLDGSHAAAFSLTGHNHSGVYSPLAHAHAGGDITSGTVAQARIDAAVARDSEIVPAVLAADGAGSTLDADLLDGKHGWSYVSLPYFGSGSLDGTLLELTNSTSADDEQPTGIRVHATATGTCSGWLSCRGWAGIFSGDYGIHASGGQYAGIFDGRVAINGNLSMDSEDAASSGNISFGAKTRQMLNLWNAEYGIGVQTSTTYVRTSSDFAVYKGGVHADAWRDPGAAGQFLMYLDNSGIALSGAGAWKPGGGSWADNSDVRLKKNVRPLAGTLDRLLRLRGVEYEWTEPRHAAALPGFQTGMIAQEVEQVFPEWVGVDEDGFKTLGFRGFEALTVEALRDLQLRGERADGELRARLDAQEAALTAQGDELAALRTQLAAQSLLIERLLAAAGRGGEATATTR